MAISRKQAKIYAIRWILQNLDYKPYIDCNKTTKFSPYESTKIFEEMDKIKDSLMNRLYNLGDNPSISNWDSPHVRKIH